MTNLTNTNEGEITEKTPIETPRDKRLANLRGPWKKGQSGNPKGRPKGSISLTETIKRKLQELTPDGKRQALEMLADNIIQDALDSSDKMRQLIWNYLDGLPKFSADITSGGEPMGVIFLPRRKQDENKQLDEPNGELGAPK
jgi:hypothetical protein